MDYIHIYRNVIHIDFLSDGGYLMFSSNQQAYIDALLPTYAKEGYKYYVCYTNTLVNSSYYYSTDPDLYVIFSQERISAADAYTFDIAEPSILVSVRSGNYSTNSNANNGARVTVSDYSAQELIIQPYEHVYTNAEFESYALQPDYYLGTGGETNVQVQGVSFIILVIAFYIFIRKLWRKL